MGLLSEIFRYAGWSVAVGILISIGFVALLFLLIRGFYPKSTFSAGSIATGAMLSLLLSFQMAPMCAAIALKSDVDDFQLWLDETVILARQYAIPQEISPEESRRIIDKAIEEYPLLGIIVGEGEFRGFDTSNISAAIAGALKECLNKVIVKLLLISLVETLAAAFIIIRLLGRNSTRQSNARRSAYTRPRQSGRRGAPVAMRRR